jgi:hypothetical protein
MSDSTDRVLVAGGGIAWLATAAPLGRHMYRQRTRETTAHENADGR